jgi:chromosome segregation ATPase
MAQPEVAAGPEHFDPSSSDDPSSTRSIDEALGRTGAQLDQARFELTLARRVQARLLKEIERLEHRLADSESERLELLERVDERDRLIAQIFGSRSWRWAQLLRRVFGRG